MNLAEIKIEIDENVFFAIAQLQSNAARERESELEIMEVFQRLMINKMRQCGCTACKVLIIIDITVSYYPESLWHSEFGLTLKSFCVFENCLLPFSFFSFSNKKSKKKRS